MDNTDLLLRVEEYAKQTQLVLGEQLGAGVQGIVFSAKSQAEGGQLAVKVHAREADYLRERNAYFRLGEHGITRIGNCKVPELTGHSDNLWIIEMTVVTRPFVLDFGGAFLDRAPDFSEEVLAEWREEKEEQFGARWPEVQAILGELEGYGVFMVDVHPGNISWLD